MSDIERDVELRDFNTLRLQSKATAWLNATSTDAIVAGILAAQRLGLSVTPLGEGSNVVLPESLDALVILPCKRQLWIRSPAMVSDSPELTVSARYVYRPAGR